MEAPPKSLGCARECGTSRSSLRLCAQTGLGPKRETAQESSRVEPSRSAKLRAVVAGALSVGSRTCLAPSWVRPASDSEMASHDAHQRLSHVTRPTRCSSRLCRSGLQVAAEAQQSQSGCRAKARLDSTCHASVCRQPADEILELLGLISNKWKQFRLGRPTLSRHHAERPERCTHTPTRGWANTLPPHHLPSPIDTHLAASAHTSHHTAWRVGAMSTGIDDNAAPASSSRHAASSSIPNAAHHEQASSLRNGIASPQSPGSEADSTINSTAFAPSILASRLGRSIYSSTAAAGSSLSLVGSGVNSPALALTGFNACLPCSTTPPSASIPSIPNHPASLPSHLATSPPTSQGQEGRARALPLHRQARMGPFHAQSEHGKARKSHVGAATAAATLPGIEPRFGTTRQIRPPSPCHAEHRLPLCRPPGRPTTTGSQAPPQPECSAADLLCRGF